MRPPHRPFRPAPPRPPSIWRPSWSPTRSTDGTRSTPFS
jgi:hypothetical protein